MARSTIRIGGIAPGTVGGIAQFLDKLATLPEGLVQGINADLNAGADELVERIKPIVPTDDMETHPGQLRDSVHKEDGRHPLSVLVEDARDAKGNFIGPHVEYGHRVRDGGGHVPAKPHFWPSVRVSKKSLRARIGRRRW